MSEEDENYEQDEFDDGFEDEFEEFCGSKIDDATSVPQSQNAETCKVTNLGDENTGDPTGDLIL